MDVTVIVANYNQLSTLPLTLTSLDVQTQKPKRVIVADDGSCDGTIDWLDSLPDNYYAFDLSYVTHKHAGYALTSIENLASSFIDSGRILLTNADLIHLKDSVRNHGEMGKDKIAGGLICEISMPASKTVRCSDIRDFPKLKDIFENNTGKLTNREYYIRDVKRNFYGIWGGNFSVAYELFAKVNGFNEEYHSLYGGEEADLIQRLLKAGGTPAWAYNSTAYHLAHPSRQYGRVALGNEKYRKEYLANNNHK